MPFLDVTAYPSESSAKDYYSFLFYKLKSNCSFVHITFQLPITSHKRRVNLLSQDIVGILFVVCLFSIGNIFFNFCCSLCLVCSIQTIDLWSS